MLKLDGQSILDHLELLGKTSKLKRQAKCGIIVGRIVCDLFLLVVVIKSAVAFLVENYVYTVDDLCQLS